MPMYKDARTMKVKSIRMKKKLLGREELIGVEARLTASVEGDTFVVEVPTDNIKLGFQLRDVIALAKATNRVYLDSKKNQTPENK